MRNTTYDLFVSFHERDYALVRPVVDELTARNLEVFFDEQRVREAGPSAPEEALRDSFAVVVFIGSHGLGGWQGREVKLALDCHATNGLPVVPVVLPGGCPPDGFLALNGWVDLAERGAIDELVATVSAETVVRYVVRPARSAWIDVRVTVRDDGWTVSVDNCETRDVESPLADASFQRALEQFREFSYRPISTDDRERPTEEGAAMASRLFSVASQIGSQLTKTLCSDGIQELIERGIGLSTEPHHLHIVVAHTSVGLESLANEALALPWELLRFGEEFPVAMGKLDVTREAYVEGLRGMSEPKSDLRVVATVCAPIDATTLNYEEECYRLSQALGEYEDRLEVTDLGTLDEFIGEIKKHNPPILHFTGHGRPGALLFETETSERHEVEVQELVAEIRAGLGWGKELPRLMFLGCCHGATATEGSREHRDGLRRDGAKWPTSIDVSSTKPASPATAASLHRAGFHQVFGYFGPVDDAQATNISGAFYTALRDGGDALVALRQARLQAAKPIIDAGRPVAVYPLGWAQIAFYQRGRNTQTNLPPTTRKVKRSARHEREVELLQERVERLKLGFVGRRRDRASILYQWKHGDRFFVVHGLGGLGKTALCSELAPILAKRLRMDGREVPVLSLSGRTAAAKAKTGRQLLVSLWEQVASARSDDEWQKTVAAIEEQGITGVALADLIGALAGVEGGLIVYVDDAESLQKSLERVAKASRLKIGHWRTKELRLWWQRLATLAKSNGPIAVLASSRYVPEETPDKSDHALGVLSRFEIVKMMTWFPSLSRIPRADAHRLAKRTDGHPRTVEYLNGLVSSYESSTFGPGGYGGTKLWEELIEPSMAGLSAELEANLLLSKLWEALEPPMQEHLGRCSCLLGPVPFEALKHLETDESSTASSDLIRFGLLTPELQGKRQAWAPHRLVVEEVQARWKGDGRAVLLKLEAWFADRFEKHDDVAGLFAAANYAMAAEDGKAGWIHVQRIAGGLHQGGRYHEAVEWVERLGKLPLDPAIKTQVDGELARLYYFTGNLAESSKLGQSVVTTRTSELGAEHADTLASMNNLAGTLWAQGDHSGARQLQETVLAARERVLGREHPDTLTSMNNLAQTLSAQGDHSGARQLQETVLAARERVLGREHPDTLTSMNNLAQTLWGQGDHSGARKLQETVLAAHERVLGREHPDTLTSMNNLAQTLWAQGDHSGARQLQETVLAAHERVLGAEHPATLTSMNNLALTLKAQGDHSGARKLQETVLAARERVLGAEHPARLTSMNNLAQTLRAQGDHSGARQLQETVLAARERVLGREHPDTLTSMNNLAQTLWAQGDHSGARKLQETVFATRQRVLGAEHPSTLIAMNNLALLFEAQGDLVGARSMYVECLRGLLSVLGSHHATFQRVLGNYLSLVEEAFPSDSLDDFVTKLKVDSRNLERSED